MRLAGAGQGRQDRQMYHDYNESAAALQAGMRAKNSRNYHEAP